MEPIRQDQMLERGASANSFSPAQRNGKRPAGALGLLNSEFGKLWDRHRDMIHAYVRRYHAWIDPEDAAELEQSIWLAVWKALPRFRGEASTATWVTAITRHAIGSWLRRAKNRRLALTQLAHDVQLDGESGWEARVVGKMTVREALERLAGRERRLLQLRYFDNLTDEQIARASGLPLGTVKGRLRAGLQHLRSWI